MGKSKKKPVGNDIHRKDDLQLHRRTNKQILKNAVDKGEDEILFLEPKDVLIDWQDDFEVSDDISPNENKLRN